MAERFMLKPSVKGPVDVWIHAVSLGEVIAATPLIEALLRRKLTVLATTMTPTGADRLRTHFKNRVLQHYLPYDLPFFQKLFFKRFNPRLGLIMETELWPNTINQAARANIPLLLINARLSERSLRSYQRAAFFFKNVLMQFNAILTQSEDDALRFKSLGVCEKKVHVMGNIKFDLNIKPQSKDIFKTLQNYWGMSRPVFIAASTHDNEEVQLLAHLKTLQQGIPHLVLLIAPRHPERFQKVYKACQDMGFRTGLRSQTSSLSPDCEIIVLDSLGELMGWYGISDYAFVGGSLVPVGGHNVLEPIAAGVPVLTGPHIDNFKTICDTLLRHEAMQIIENPQDLVEALIKLSTDKPRKDHQVHQAMAVFKKNKGAIDYCLKKIDELLLPEASHPVLMRDENKM